MRSLIRFEDTYGIADIFLAANKITSKIERRKFTKLTDDSYITTGTAFGQCIGMEQNDILKVVHYDIRRIVFVIDVDNEGGNKQEIVSKEYLKLKIDELKLRFDNIKYKVKLEFIPVVYSAETIMLYQFISDSNPETDIESLVHPIDTNRFQLLLLTRLLRFSNPRRTKKVHTYLDLNKLKTKIKINLAIKDSINRKLLEWILKDCPLEQTFMSEVEVLQFLDKVANLFNDYQKHIADFKIAEEQLNSHVHLGIFLKTIKNKANV